MIKTRLAEGNTLKAAQRNGSRWSVKRNCIKKNNLRGTRQMVLSFIIAMTLVLMLAPNLNSPATAGEVAGPHDVGANLGYSGDDGYTLILKKVTTTGEYFQFGVTFELDDYGVTEFNPDSNPWMGDGDFIRFENIPAGTEYFTYEADTYGCTTTIAYSGTTEVTYHDPATPSFGGVMTGNIEITFTNERHGTLPEPTYVTFKAIKSANADMTSGQFRFDLFESDIDADHVILVKYVNNSSDSTREELEIFTAEFELAGTYYYLLKESGTDENGWTIDQTQYLFKVEVAEDDESPGYLTAEVGYIRITDGGSMWSEPFPYDETDYTTWSSFSNNYEALKYPYRIIYYYDEADLDEFGYIEQGGSHWLGTEGGITEFENDTPFSSSMVDSDFPEGWVDEYLDSCPSPDYESGSLEYIVSYITEEVIDNVVVVVYKLTPTYSYIVKYYKDRVNESNLLATEFDDPEEYPVDTIITNENVTSDLGIGWIDRERPNGYDSGTVVNYTTITTVTENNVVVVLYIISGGSNYQTQDNGSTGSTDPDDPDDPDDANNPNDLDKQSDQKNQAEQDDPDGSTDTSEQRDPVEQVTTGNQSLPPGGSNQGVAPNPSLSGHIIVPSNDGIYLELDENGVPLGEWRWDNDTETWIFDEYAPMGMLPQTGGATPPPYMFLLLIGALTGFGIVLWRVLLFKPKHR